MYMCMYIMYMYIHVCVIIMVTQSITLVRLGR